MQLRGGGSALELNVLGRRAVRDHRAETRLAWFMWTGRAPAACGRPLWGISCSNRQYRVALRGTFRCLWRAWRRGDVLLVIALLTLFVVLYHLYFDDAAGRRERGGAWRSPLCLVGTAVLVYDLGAHFGGALARKVVARRRAPAVRASAEGKASRSCLDEEGGAGSGRADWLCGCRGQKLDSAGTGRINAGGGAEGEGVLSGVWSLESGVWRKGGQVEVVAVTVAVAVGDDTSSDGAACGADVCERVWSQRPKGIGMLFIMEPFCVPDRRYLWTRC
jgi:hypothetical protein